MKMHCVEFWKETPRPLPNPPGTHAIQHIVFEDLGGPSSNTANLRIIELPSGPSGMLQSCFFIGQGKVKVYPREGFLKEISEIRGDEAVRAVWQEAGMDELMEDFTDLLDDSIDGADRVSRIVADLKGFSRVDQVGEEAADINRIIEQVCNVAAGQIKDKADVTIEAGVLPPFECYAAQLGQVFLNILINAVDAVTDRVAIHFATQYDGKNIIVKIRDNGSGMAPEIKARIFEPFFTTKDVGKGTGLGLTVSNDIIRSYDGRIDVESTVGEGTIFTITLPVKQ